MCLSRWHQWTIPMSCNSWGYLVSSSHTSSKNTESHSAASQVLGPTSEPEPRWNPGACTITHQRKRVSFPLPNNQHGLQCKHVNKQYNERIALNPVDNQRNGSSPMGAREHLLLEQRSVRMTNPSITTFATPLSNQCYLNISKDFNPIHVNQCFSNFASLPGTITYSMWTSAASRKYLESVVTGGRPKWVKL